MTSPRQLAHEIVDREGGFVNDPDLPPAKSLTVM